MKIALCTTTIHVPHALKLMRKCSADVKFFVAGDLKSPHEDIFDLLREDCHPACYIDRVESPHVISEDEAIGNYKCSEAIGWNTLARRNIAFLEALKWGADIIVSWDNDNIPVNADYFKDFRTRFLKYDALGTQVFVPTTFNGIKVDGDTYRWFDPGSLLVPATRHRGFPYSFPAQRKCEPVTDVKVGVAAGLVIGDPDIDATTRMELRPDIGAVHLLGQTGVVVDPHTWTVFNSQNTAVIRELVLAWFMMPNVGRHDDIYASLIVQRVARERDLHVHFGPPFTYQQRNEHNLITDLRAEIDGMENVEKLAALLDITILPAKSVIEDTRIIYEQLTNCSFIPEKSARAGLLWLEDCEGVM